MNFDCIGIWLWKTILMQDQVQCKCCFANSGSFPFIVILTTDFRLLICILVNLQNTCQATVLYCHSLQWKKTNRLLWLNTHMLHWFLILNQNFELRENMPFIYTKLTHVYYMIWYLNNSICYICRYCYWENELVVNFYDGLTRKLME